MSASTGTLQQPIRVGPLALVVAVAAFMLAGALALALGSVGPKGETVPGNAIGVRDDWYVDAGAGSFDASTLGNDGFVDFRGDEIGTGAKAPYSPGGFGGPRLDDKADGIGQPRSGGYPHERQAR